MQPSFFDSDRAHTPYQRTSETSRAAAQRAKRFAPSQADRVLAWFRQQGSRGGTQKECDRALGIGRPSVAARVNGLERDRLIDKISATRERCAVYVAK